MKHFSFGLILLLFIGCKGKEGVVDHLKGNPVKSEELVFTGKEILRDTMIFKHSSILPLETTQESMFRKIDRISILNEQIFILDKSIETIFIFDKDGKFVDKIYRRGQGPGEYDGIADFCLDNETNEVLVLCHRPYKLMKFSQNGQFISEISLSVFYNGISMSDNQLFCSIAQSGSKNEIGCFDKNMKPIYEGIPVRENVNSSCHNGGNYIVRSNRLTYTRRFDPSLYYLTEDHIEKAYEFDFGKYTMPASVAEENDCTKFFQTCGEQGYIFSITNAVESDKYILFNTNQAVCLYSKKTNQLHGYKYILNSTINSGSSIYYPNNGDGSSLIATMDASSLSYYEEETIKSNPVIAKLVATVKSEDNPILIIYKFK